MRVLLDESLPRRLRGEIPGHEVSTVPEMGWAGKTNGELLSLASGQFDVLLTADQGLEFQQNLTSLEVSIVILAGRTNRFDDLKPLVRKVLDVILNIGAGEVVRVTS